MGKGNVASRISAVDRDERGPLIRYQALQDLADIDRGTDLNLNVHRYKAIANQICVGFYSSLKLAFSEVDSAAPLWGTTWEQSPEESEEGLLNYVLDVVANRAFVRVAIQRKAQGV